MTWTLGCIFHFQKYEILEDLSGRCINRIFPEATLHVNVENEALRGFDKHQPNGSPDSNAELTVLYLRVFLT